MKIPVITLILIAKLTSSPGQSTNIDSLQKALAMSKEDTNRVLILQGLGMEYAYSGLDSSLIYADSGFQLSKKIKYIKGEALCLTAKATYYRMTGFSAKGMHYAMEALPFFEKLKDPEDIILCNLLIAWTLEDQQYPRLCIDYVLKVLPTAIQIKSKWRGYCYSTLAINYKLLNVIDSALLFGLKADPLMSKDEFNIATIGAVYLKMNKIAEAERYLSRIVNRENSGVHTSNVLSEFYKQKNQLDSAIYFAKKALLDSKDIKQGALQSEIAAITLKELYQKKGLRDSVVAYMQATIDAKDRLASQERTNLISLLLNQQLQRQEMETRQLQYEKQIQIYLFLAVLVIVLLISLFLFRHARQKQKANLILEKMLTELKSMQAQLIQSEKMASLGELTAGIAHEIQNPLNFVNNFSEVNKELIEELKGERLKVEGERDEKLEDQLLDDLGANEEKISHHGKRADAIVKGMLQHSKVSAGQKEPTDVNALADEYLRLSYHAMRANDKSFTATIRTDFDKSLNKILVIPQDFGRVLLNLCNNAFHSLKEKARENQPGYEPTILITTRKMNTNVVITVKDNGIGVPEKNKAKIFQPFFTTKPTGQGTGLGLSLSYDIITKEHGGEIKVESKEGEGAEFTVSLPG